MGDFLNVTGLILVIVGVLGAFVALRFVVLWYWRIDELVRLEREQRDYLQYLAKTKEWELAGQKGEQP